MLLRFDYLKSLENQCDIICPKADLKRSESIFCEVCRNLSKDFLPPIEREDIAAISYSLVDITSKAVRSEYPDEIKKQITSLKLIIKDVFTKSKTCGEDIRRLVEINVNFKSGDNELKVLNKALSDCFRTILCAYFRNL